MPTSKSDDAGPESSEEPTVIAEATEVGEPAAAAIDPFADVTPPGATEVVVSEGDQADGATKADDGVSAAADSVKARAGAAAGASKAKASAAKDKAATAAKDKADAAKAKTDAAKEKAAGAAKETGGRVRSGMGRAREKAGAAASDAKVFAVKATSDARERAAGADVEGFARSTTSLIDSARPFFLAGCAAIFAILGFLEGNEWTASIFAIGAILCVGGAAFSAEFNALLHARATRYTRQTPPE